MQQSNSIKIIEGILQFPISSTHDSYLHVLDKLNKLEFPVIVLNNQLDILFSNSSFNQFCATHEISTFQNLKQFHETVHIFNYLKDQQKDNYPFNLSTPNGKNLGPFILSPEQLRINDKSYHLLYSSNHKFGISENQISFQPLLEQLGIRVEQYDLNAKVISFNQIAAQYLGGKPEDFQGKELNDIYSNEQSQVYLNRMKLCRQTGTSISFIDKTTWSGGISWFKNIYSIIYSTDGKIAGIQIVTNDITSIKTMEKNLYEEEKNIKTFIDKDIIELTKVQEELNKTKEKYKTLSDASFECIFISKKGICIGQNKTSEITFGYTNEEAIGKAGTDWIIPEDREMVMNNMLNNKTEAYRTTALRKDGTSFPCEIQAKIFEENEEIIRITAVRDITDRVRAENALRQSEKIFKDLFENSADAVALASNSKIFDCNKAFLKLFEYKTKNEIIGLHPYLLSPEYQENGDLSKDVIEKNNKILYETGTNKFEWIHRKKNGENFPAEVLLTYLGKNTKGKKILHAVIRDITDRKVKESEINKAKEKTEKSERKFRKLFEKSGDAVFILEDTTIVNCNQTSVKLFGYENFEDIIGKTPFQLSPKYQAENQLSVEKAIKEIEIARKHASNRFEWLHIKRSGIIFPCEVLLTYLGKDEKGKNHTYAVMRDITDRKIKEKQIIRAKEQAEESDRLKSAFLANMSHEIRTPMNGIMGFAELLKEPQLEEGELKQYVDVIERSGKRMLNIINDLIDISRIEAQQMDVQLEDTIVNDQIKYLEKFFLPEAQSKKLHLTTHMPLSEEESHIYSDKEKLYAILTNLIKNALKYTREGRVEFGYRDKKRELEFFVSDTGTGIPRQKQSAIFERFVQAEMEHNRKYEGAGLGLAIAKAYVEMLGGSIWIEKSNQFGSEFCFTIPKRAKASRENAQHI